MLRTTFRWTCPSCGSGPLFRSGYDIHSACPDCNFDLTGRDGAHYGGPMVLGYAVGGLTGLVTFLVLFFTYGYRDWIVWTAVAMAVVSILGTYRHCRAWWTWLLFRTGELGQSPKSD